MPQALLGLLSRFILFTSLTYIAHTYAGQALLRVRGRAMHLRAGLDGDDVIIKLSLVHLSLTLMPDRCL